MRPGPIGPGNMIMSTDVALNARASMRPGPIGPGNLNWELDVWKGILASMRPGPIGPGNKVVGSLLRKARFGFNEARPNWAGKCRRAGAGSAPASGFNEARPNWAGK